LDAAPIGPRVAKPQTVRALGAVEIAPLAAVVRRISEQVWTMEDARKENRFEVFHHTRHIILRFIEGNRDHRVFYANPVWAALSGCVLPVMDAAVAAYGFAAPIFPKVMLARLAAGGVIDAHSDGGGSNLFTHKIHVPLQTNDEVRVVVAGQPFHLQTGQAYELNNIASHSVENLGATDRVHLVFEVFDGAGAEARP
jgi:hypothetical protein